MAAKAFYNVLIIWTWDWDWKMPINSAAAFSLEILCSFYCSFYCSFFSPIYAVRITSLFGLTIDFSDYGFVFQMFGLLKIILYSKTFLSNIAIFYFHIYHIGNSIIKEDRTISNGWMFQNFHKIYDNFYFIFNIVNEIFLVFKFLLTTTWSCTQS